MSKVRKYSFLITDLIDAITIDQIKEVLLSPDQHHIYADEMSRITHDIDLLLENTKCRTELTGRIIKLIIFLAQSNLHVWQNKERMKVDTEKYYELLEHAQDLNGIRNHVRNLLMESFNELKPCTSRATFLNYRDKRWYSKIIMSLGVQDENNER